MGFGKTADGRKPHRQDQREQRSDQAEDDRDAALLRHLALARGRSDGALREQLLLAELLGRHRPNIRRIARYRAHSLRPSDADSLRSSASASRRSTPPMISSMLDFGKPFTFVVADNIDWEVKDFARRHERTQP